MKRLRPWLIAIPAVYVVAHVENVPITNRKRFIDLSVKKEMELAKDSYYKILKQYGPYQLSPFRSEVGLVKKVASRIVEASGMKLDWKVHVIESNEKNAFVLPGGKIFIFTGILPVCESEDGLAIVIGHELAHCFLRHSAEKISISKIATFAKVLASFVFDAPLGISDAATNILMSLPFSRKMEMEADFVGLLFAAKACYNPEVAVSLWKRMDNVQNLEFLSTHPKSKKRADYLKSKMPEATKLYQQSDCHMLNRFRRLF